MKRLLSINGFGGGRDPIMRAIEGGTAHLRIGLPARFGVVSIKRLIAAGCGIAFSFFAALEPVRAAPPNHGATRERVLAEVRIDHAGAPIVVEATIHGAPYRLLVATGCSGTLLDVRHRAALGKPTGKTVIEDERGPADIETFHVPEIRIGGLLFLLFDDIACGRFECTDAHGVRIDGILGMDALQRSVMRIDFDGGTLQFLDSAEPRLGRPVPMFRKPVDEWKRPYVRAVVGNRAEEFLIDTGDTAFFSGARHERLMLSSRHQVPLTARAPVRISGASADVALVAGNSVSIGGFRHSNLVFRAGTAASTFGLGYLSRYCVVFDFLNDVVYLRPGKNFNRPDRYDLSGMDIQRDGERFCAIAVSRESAAERAGVAAGDVILAVDGTRANLLGRSAILRSLCEAELHVLEIDRRGSSLRIELDLQCSAKPDTAKGAGAQRP